MNKTKLIQTLRKKSHSLTLYMPFFFNSDIYHPIRIHQLTWPKSFE